MQRTPASPAGTPWRICNDQKPSPRPAGRERRSGRHRANVRIVRFRARDLRLVAREDDAHATGAFAYEDVRPATPDSLPHLFRAVSNRRPSRQLGYGTPKNFKNTDFDDSVVLASSEGPPEKRIFKIKSTSTLHRVVRKRSPSECTLMERSRRRGATIKHDLSAQRLPQGWYPPRQLFRAGRPLS